jgi:hypothetical protein
MQINMTTFGGRKRHYIHDTLESLFSSDWKETNAPVHLIMGSEDEQHVQEYAAHPSVRIVPWDMETNSNLRWNCTLNKIRALRCGDDDHLLICEDDILFPSNWFSALHQATAEIEDQEYVLSLFAATPHLEKAELLAGKQWVKEYPTCVLQGAQALFYPTKAIRHKVADYLQENLTLACGDELIGRCARAYAQLYATREALVRNVGATSCFHLMDGNRTA